MYLHKIINVYNRRGKRCLAICFCGHNLRHFTLSWKKSLDALKTLQKVLKSREKSNSRPFLTGVVRYCYGPPEMRWKERRIFLANILAMSWAYTLKNITIQTCKYSHSQFTHLTSKYIYIYIYILICLLMYINTCIFQYKKLFGYKQLSFSEQSAIILSLVWTFLCAIVLNFSNDVLHSRFSITVVFKYIVFFNL